jgi:hypothetical protein
MNPLIMQFPPAFCYFHVNLKHTTRKQNSLTSKTLNGQVFGLEVDSVFSDPTFLACDDTVSALWGGTWVFDCDFFAVCERDLVSAFSMDTRPPDAARLACCVMANLTWRRSKLRDPELDRGMAQQTLLPAVSPRWNKQNMNSISWHNHTS